MRAGNRIGRFRVSQEFLRQNWEELIPMMGNFVIVDLVRRWDLAYVEYVAYSPLFDEWPMDFEAPEYDITVDSNVMPALIRAIRRT